LTSPEFPLAPVVLGYVLGPLLEENFRRALTISRGSVWIFVEHPICAVLTSASVVLLLAKILAEFKRSRCGSPKENLA
jgi:putative tricarboxylic transport membrane protein